MAVTKKTTVEIPVFIGTTEATITVTTTDNKKGEIALSSEIIAALQNGEKLIYTFKDMTDANVSLTGSDAIANMLGGLFERIGTAASQDDDPFASLVSKTTSKYGGW